MQATRAGSGIAASGTKSDQCVLYPLSQVRNYVVAIRPYGDARDQGAVWTIDWPKRRLPGSTCQLTMKPFAGEQRTLVRQSAPQTDWTAFFASRADPLQSSTIEGTGKVRVVPGDNSGIAYVAFVDARSGDVDSLNNRHNHSVSSQVRLRLRHPLETGAEGETTAETPTVIVQRVC